MQLSADDSVRYLTKTGENIGGPYSFEGLESLVYLKRITPDTLVSREGSGTYTPLRESELGPRLFKNLAAPRDPRVWAPPGKEADFSNRTRLQLGQAKFERVNRHHPKRGKVDVFDLLHDIRQEEIVSGHDHVREKRQRFRISKRTKDFWILLIAGNVLFLGSAVALQNTASLVFGIAGSGLYTFGLLWSMYGVMDRY